MKTNNSVLKLVQEALANESKLKACLDNIYILENDGVVLMAGAVTQESLKALAKKIVSAVPGVDSLIDDLKIEPTTSHRVGVQIDWARGSMVLT